jgi:hypothetical protein
VLDGFIIAISLLFSVPVQTELEDGFYLTVDCAVRSEIKRKNMLDERKTVCLSQLPFVAINEIEGVSTIVGSQMMDYFDLYLSPKAVSQFNTVRAALKGATIALVVDNKVVFLIAPEDDIERTLRIIVFSETKDLYRVRAKIIDQLAKAKK